MEALDDARKRGKMKVVNQTSKPVYRYNLQALFFDKKDELFEISSMGISAAVGSSVVGANSEQYVYPDGRTDNYDTSRIEGVITSVEFTDGTKWNAEH
jgi:hypothetical protein